MVTYGSALVGSTILLVEDDPMAADAIQAALDGVDCTISVAGTGEEAKQLLKQSPPDLVLLDLLLPDVEGLVLCAELKETADVPLVVCSGSKREADRVLALRLGAEDFVSKPFNVHELLARLEAVLRRCREREALRKAQEPTAGTDVRQAGPLTIEHGQRRVLIGQEVLSLTPAEYQVLWALAEQPGRVVTREELAQAVWGDRSAAEGRGLDAHVQRLRGKLSAGPPGTPTVETVRGFGFRLG